MLIGCGSLAVISIFISLIIAASILGAYMPEIYAKSQGSAAEYSAYITSLSETLYDKMNTFSQNNALQTMINAAQIIVVLIVFKLLYKRPISQMGLSTGNWLKNMGIGCLTGIISITLYPLIVSLSGIGMFTDFSISNLASVNMLLSLICFVSVGFYEEILCRGFFMTALKTTRNKWVILILPAVIFGLMHWANPGFSVIPVINLMLFGLAFGYMLIKTGSIWMSIGYHIVWNFFQGNVYGIQVSGLDQTSTLMKYTQAGSDILTGGNFGAEGGLICTAILLALLAYIHFGLNSAEPPNWTLESDLPFNTRHVR